MARKTRFSGVYALPDGKYRIVARVRKDGDILHKQETVSTNLEEARRIRESYLQELRTGKHQPDSSLESFEQFEHILALYQEKKGPFCKSHEALIKQVKIDLGKVQVSEFATRFDGYLNLVRQTKTRRGELPSPALLNRRIEVVKAAFGVAVSCGYLESNPVTRARFPERKEIPRDMSISDDDAARLLATARGNPRWRHLEPAISFMLQVPIRKSELVNMLVGDVDIFAGSIRVRNGTTKNDQGTYKPIPPDMMDYFKRRIVVGKPDEPVFFRTKKIKPLGDFHKAWSEIRKKCGLPDLRIHDTRHVSATALLDAGTPEQVVMTVANWKTNMLRTYYHRDPKKALQLVRFPAKCDSVVIASEGAGS